MTQVVTAPAGLAAVYKKQTLTFDDHVRTEILTLPVVAVEADGEADGRIFVLEGHVVRCLQSVRRIAHRTGGESTTGFSAHDSLL